ncbi:Arfaptin domain/BAR domain containing protein [Heracleum sosnowskyi]|uniref:Arfaptin domain/BAR domain containing protein n=1 Tax=Heracleum sosnowskyi TaxID=360622 RepID=A0AAD8ITM7_9APIA|nr:Arfaptin domain/BAR domain containing protein [Heracleum sosnowskyi]
MKSSIDKIKKFALGKSQTRDEIFNHSFAPLDAELAQAAKDMQDIRSFYDELLSAAAATANSAYEFSVSLLEMGTCLSKSTAASAYGESGSVLQMLGKAQLQLQKIADTYRSQVFLTITNPSESLLSELQKVEDMKLQCDDKREVYEHMLARYREKGKLRTGICEQTITSQQVKEARTEFEEAARLCIFRAESLKQGQGHSLLTQAARHHTVQLNFFFKGLESLVEVDPQVKQVSKNQHIDCQVGLNEGEDDGSETRNSSMSNEHGELDEADLPYPRSLTAEETARIRRAYHEARSFSQRSRPSSLGDTIYSEKLNPTDRGREMQASVPKLQTYVLPTPAKISSAITTSSALQSSYTSLRSSSTNLRNSSPLRTERNSNCSSIPLPPPDRRSFPQLKKHNSFDLNLNKRAYSGPSPSKPILSTSGPLTSEEHLSGLLCQVPVSQLSTSANLSRSASTPPVSSRRITELRELPRPPDSIALKMESSSIAHSVPLVVRNHEHPPSNKIPKLTTNIASRLPSPALTVPRSFSVPSSSSKAKPSHMAKMSGPSQIPYQVEEFTSPPLTPLSLSDMKPLSKISKAVSSSGKMRGGR